jgi:hypothetical protein
VHFAQRRLEGLRGASAGAWARARARAGEQREEAANTTRGEARGPLARARLRAVLRRLDEQHFLRRLLHGAAPLVHAPGARQRRHARRDALLNERKRNLSRRLGIRRWKGGASECARCSGGQRLAASGQTVARPRAHTW